MPWNRPAALVTVALLALASACAPSDDDLFGAVLEVESHQPFVYAEDFRRRLHRVLEESCEHVGLDPSRLYGLRLRVVDGPIPCGEVPNARGCARTDGSSIVISTLAWISTAPPVECIEDTPLPHEVLHLRIADGEHLDPRWSSHDFWEPLRRSLVQPDCGNEPATLLW